MIRGAGRVAAVAAIAALAGVAWLALFYGRSPALRSSSTSTPPPASSSGIYTAERDPTPAAGRSRGPADALTIRLPISIARSTWTLDVRVRGARAGGAANPELQFFADGVHLADDRDDRRLRRRPRRRSRRSPTASRPDARAALVGDVRARAGGSRASSASCSTGSRSRRTASCCRRARAFAGVALASAAAGAGDRAARRDRRVGGRRRPGHQRAGWPALVAARLRPLHGFPIVAARAALWIVARCARS